MEMAKTKLHQLSQHGELLDRYGTSIRILGQRELVKPDVLEAVDRATEMTKHNTNAILNICFPYTSHDEITTAIRSTVSDYSNHLPSQTRSFSESHIVDNIRARRLSNTTLKVRSHSPHSPSSGTASDTEDSTTSSSTTLNPDSPSQDPLTPEDIDVKSRTRSIFPDPENITSKVLNDHMFTAGLPPLDLLVRTSGVRRLSDFMLWQCHEDTEVVFLNCLWPDFDLWTFFPVLLEWQWKRKKGHEKEKSLQRSSAIPKVKVG